MGGIGAIVGAYATSHAADKAAETSTSSSQAALLYAKQKDAQERADTIAAQNANYGQWKAGVDQTYQQYLARHNALSPYAANGVGAGNAIAGLLHVQPGAAPAAAPAPVLPPPPTYTTVPATGGR